MYVDLIMRRSLQICLLNSHAEYSFWIGAQIVPEPVAKWQDVGKEHHNILESFYAEPERYAYTFQNYVFVTRLMQERESANGVKPLRLMERSVFSDRMVCT